MCDLELTRERLIPGKSPDAEYVHRRRYEFAGEFARHRRVLDVGCGTGYGAAMLAASASSVSAFDISPEAIEYANWHFGETGARFYVADAMCIESYAVESAFGVIACFELLEHLSDPHACLTAVARVLPPEGLLIASTPNRVRFSLPDGTPGSPYHLVEWSLREFTDLLAAHLQVRAMYAQEGGDWRPKSDVDEQDSVFVAVCAHGEDVDPGKPETMTWLRAGKMSISQTC